MKTNVAFMTTLTRQMQPSSKFTIKSSDFTGAKTKVFAQSFFGVLQNGDSIAAFNTFHTKIKQAKADEL